MEGSEINILQILWESGVVVKLVLLALIGLSVFSWAIIFQKKKSLQILEGENEKFLKNFEGNLKLLEIYQLSHDYPHSSLGKMYRTGFEELQKISTKIGGSSSKLSLADYFSQYGLEPLERALKKGATVSQENMGKKLTTLATIGSISPFVGLFGTVWGIIDSFAGLSSGGGTIESVAPGIAEALVATAVGLAAAIPAVWFFNTFNSKISALNSQMEAFGEDYINLVSRSILISNENPTAEEA